MTGLLVEALAGRWRRRLAARVVSERPVRLVTHAFGGVPYLLGDPATGVRGAAILVAGGAVEDAVLRRVDGGRHGLLVVHFHELGLDRGGVNALFVEHHLDPFGDHHVVLQVATPGGKRRT